MRRIVTAGTPRRIAMLTVHMSPLDPPGAGDAGGLNVYVVATASRLADRGVQVEIFTRATSSAQPRTFLPRPGVQVTHIVAGPYEGLAKQGLAGQLCAFTGGLMRAEARHDPGRYDLVHSHYRLSGQLGWPARGRWGVPLVHCAHTLARVKNMLLADGDAPEPLTRVVGEERVVAEADRLIASTADEAEQLIRLYRGEPGQVSIVAPASTCVPSPPARSAERGAGWACARTRSYLCSSGASSR